MEKLKIKIEKSRSLSLLIFLCSFVIYFIYFYPILLNPNSILSSITSDTLKNYFTFVFHIKNDAKALQFSGMNYPFGEHIVYTDCQPLISNLLRLFPFTHSYLIGIMHWLIFFSFMISPVIIHKIFLKLELDKFSSFLFALGIALLSPQFLKINAGHFALAYGCVIPISILLVLSALKGKNFKLHLILFTFNLLLFFLHPYLGFCSSLFTFFSIVFFQIFERSKDKIFKQIALALFSGIAPLVFFKLFMQLSDQHSNRTIEPYGAEVMVENIDSILSPVFGPFQKLMEFFFNERSGHYEGHTYLGFFTILLSLVFLIILPFIYKRLIIKKEVLAIFISSLVFLFIAFGYHLSLLEILHLKSAMLNQFRAVCRFAWLFYFTLPIFLITILYHSFKNIINTETFKKASKMFAILFLCFNAIEGHYFFKLDEAVFWKSRNIFSEEGLNNEEKSVLAKIQKSKPQAIIPLPLFHGGSEMYDRQGSNNSMIPSMIYSYHSNTPILSVLMSRTSMDETKDMISLLNSYKDNRNIENKLNANDFFVLSTKDAFLPDEARLYKEIKQFGHNDTLEFGFIDLKKLLTKKLSGRKEYIYESQQDTSKTKEAVYVNFENRKPFLNSNIQDYEKVFTLDSNIIETGDYIVSFHYHYKETNYRALANNLIVNQISNKDNGWIYHLPLRCLSGFYEGYAVYEQRINLEKNSKYEFLLKGDVNMEYKISNFMLRPENLNVIVIKANQDSTFNNFPTH